MPRKREPWVPADPNGRSFRERFPAKSTMRGNLGMYCVPTFHLREAIVPLVDREGTYLCEDGDYTKWGDNGKYTVVSERVSKITGLKPESCYRKIYDICNANGSPRDNVNADFAEAMFIACGERLEDHPVPRFPATKEAAWEMAHVWADDHSEVASLANALMRLAVGYATADEIVDPGLQEQIVKKRNAARQRKRMYAKRRRDAARAA